MKIEHKIETNGIICSLSFEASVCDLRGFFEASAADHTEEEIEDLFLQSAEQTVQKLAQVRKEFLVSLMTSYTDISRERLEDMQNDMSNQEKAQS